MTNLRTALLILGLAAVSAGCAGSRRKPEPPGPTPAAATASVPDLARRLGLVVVTSSERGATLRNAANTVSLFPDPRGRAYVNGKPVGAAGGIEAVRGVLAVPLALEEAIRAALVAAPPVEIAPEPDRPAYEPPPSRTIVGRVVVDAGHGGPDTGTPKRNDGSVRGNGIIDEKDVNLDAALRLERILRLSGVEVLLTRRSDVAVDLDERPAFGNRYRPRLFVSLHANSAESPSVDGFTIYVARQASSESMRAAEILRRELAGTGIRDRGIHREDFRVVRKSAGPAVLVEMGFLTNPAEARRLASSAHRERLAQAVARGILAFLRSP